MLRHFLIYAMIRIGSYPLSFVPFPILQKLGRLLGTAGFFLIPKFRKRTLNHLSLAKSLHLTEKECREIAIASFQNLMMTLLEMSRLLWKPEGFQSLATCENETVFEEAKKKGKGVVLLSSHQANWEIGIYDHIPGSKGVTVGRPLANLHLYRWLLQMRNRRGNHIILPKDALTEGVRALKQGQFFAILGDQAKVTSRYHYPFLGMRAWTNIAPALIAYKADSPLCVVAKKRNGTKHHHIYSELIWPDRTQPWKIEVKRMMDEALKIVEQSIKENPGEWLWQHRRWKQGGSQAKKKYRKDFILVIMPDDPLRFEQAVKKCKRLETLYPRAFFTVMVPEGYSYGFPVDWKINFYKNFEEILMKDYSYQLVFDFYMSNKIGKHFKKLGAFEVINEIEKTIKRRDAKTSETH